MGTLLLDQIKKQTASFLNGKYKTARMALSDVTEAEMLAEEATNKDPCTPDAMTMTRIAEASFDIDDYLRIAEILHRRLFTVDWDEWRQSYKALVVLEFLLTHGPEEFSVEFQCDAEVIQELGSFTHIDERGFNWGARMQKKSDQILKLLEGGVTLREARLKALKITKEIQGFGSSLSSSSSSPSATSSEVSPSASSSCSFSTSSTPTYNDSTELNMYKITPTKGDTKSYSQGGIGNDNIIVFPLKNVDSEEGNPHWEENKEKDNLIDSEDENEEKPKGFVSGICSKLLGSGEKIEFRSLSNVGRKGASTKKFGRQYSLWY